MSTNLFGEEEPEPSTAMNELTGKQKRKTVPAGYVCRPGSGPKGETCGSCLHKVILRMGGSYRKCALARPGWTHGIKTDILARSPACAKWEPLPKGLESPWGPKVRRFIIKTFQGGIDPPPK